MQFEKKKEIKKQFANLFYTGSFSSRQYTAYSKSIKIKTENEISLRIHIPDFTFHKTT